MRHDTLAFLAGGLFALACGLLSLRLTVDYAITGCEKGGIAISDGGSVFQGYDCDGGIVVLEPTGLVSPFPSGEDTI